MFEGYRQLLIIMNLFKLLQPPINNPIPFYTDNEAAQSIVTKAKVTIQLKQWTLHIMSFAKLNEKTQSMFKEFRHKNSSPMLSQSHSFLPNSIASTTNSFKKTIHQNKSKN